MTDAPEERRPRWGRRLAAAGLLVALASPWWAPPILRRMEFFNVRHVVVRGARFSAPGELVARLRIDTTVSIWRPLAPLEARLRLHPQIRDAHVSRRLPSTLIVDIDEIDPVALSPSSSGMRAYDASGKGLPLDPTRTPVDLPIIARPDTALLRFLGELKAGEPALFARISELRRAGRDELLLDIVSPLDQSLPVRAMLDISVDRLAQISLVEQDLQSRRAHVSELDFRFRDQVIARLQ